ncbi:polyprenyl synthetase family protein [Geoglobus acetivorans]|uniref:Polyprenyl synthetase family protein n=1 Tax=Geoglobus acetivorans TaxID=565033 RepID=A0ABZ3H7F4_GEOAI|nr:polyprenyl synthetase family protein [Geoglobus acetivorans]
MISEIIKDRAKLVNEKIGELLKEHEPEGLYRAARHYLKAGGKRLRPVITLLSAEALGEDYRKAIHAAIAIETVHNFTLVHDDIMDEDEMRRGVKTVHTLFGIPTAILAGDTLYAEAFEILSMSDAPPENIVRAVSKLARVCVEICEGQFMDMSFEERDCVGESEYLEMVMKKTGVLIGISASIPAVLFGKDESVEKALWNYGVYSGIGFQIHDDLLDISGKGKIGKDWGSDILEGKKTLIVIKAFEEGIELETFGKGRASEEELERDIKKLFDCGAVDYAREKAREYITLAKKNLEVIDESPARSYLIELADYLIERDH